MYKKLIILSLCIFIGFGICIAQDNKGDSLDQSIYKSEKNYQYHIPFDIHYKLPNPRFSIDPDSVSKVVLMVSSHPLKPPEAIPMIMGDGLYQAAVLNSDTTVKAVLLSFQIQMKGDSSIHVDDYDGMFWPLVVHSNHGLPVQGAYHTLALFHLAINDINRRSLKSALSAIDQELIHYPDSRDVKRLQYSTLLRRYRNDEQTRAKIKKEIEKLLKSHPSDVSSLRFAAGIFRMLQENKDAQFIEEKLIKLDPKGEEAAGKALQSIMKESDLDFRIQELETFLETYNRSAITDFALSSLISALIQQEEISKLIPIGDRLLNEADSPNAAGGLAGIAGVLSERNLDLDRAILFGTKAITLVTQTGLDKRPPEINEMEWSYQLIIMEARFRDILGWTYLKKGEVFESIRELEKSVNKKLQETTLYHYAKALEKSGERDAAIRQFARAAAFGGDIGKLAMQELKPLWVDLGRDTLFLRQFQEKEKKWVQNELKNEILSKRRIRPASDFELEDIEGDWIRFIDQRGSVICLSFWATWSRSSRRMLNAFQDLADTYGQDVLFLTIATDVNPDKVYQYVRRKRFNFTVLFNDDTDRLYNLNGVPVIFIIDSKGDIHFEHKGYRQDTKDAIAVELEDLLGL